MELSRYQFDHDHPGITMWNDRAAGANTALTARVALRDGIDGAIRGRSCQVL